MKLVKLNDTNKFKNSDTCYGWEYNLDDKDINCSVAKIKGRYPDKGYCTNEECKELVYVIEGHGRIIKKNNDPIAFEAQDTMLIDKKEVYFWEGNCTIMMACVPAWYYEQHKLVDE